MQLSLLIGRNAVEAALQPVIMLLEIHLDMGTTPRLTMGVEQAGGNTSHACRNIVYTAFCQYLDHHYSPTINPISVEYLVDEYLGGQRVPPAVRQELQFLVSTAFPNALVPLHAYFQQMVNDLEAMLYEIQEVMVAFPRDQRQLLFTIECGPVDESVFKRYG